MDDPSLSFVFPDIRTYFSAFPSIHTPYLLSYLRPIAQLPDHTSSVTYDLCHQSCQVLCQNRKQASEVTDVGNPWWKICVTGGFRIAKVCGSGRNVQGSIDCVRGYIKVFCVIPKFGRGSDVSYFITCCSNWVLWRNCT